MVIAINRTFRACNGSDEDLHRTISNITILQIFLYLSISIIGTTGNVLVCRAIARSSHKRTNEFFILNLAITDLGTSLLSIPLDLAELIKGHFPFGSFFCNLVYPFQTVLMIVSVMTLLCMSVERYRAIATPLKRRVPSNVAKLSIISSWVFALACVVPYATVLGFEDKMCTETWSHDSHRKLFTLTLFLLFYLIPMFVITVSYIKIVVILFRTLKNVKKMLGANDTKTWNMGRRRAKQNLNMVKVFVVAVVAFACCLLPTHVLWLWHDYGNGNMYKHFGIVLAFSNIMIYSNSAINPFIFGKLNLATCFGENKKRRPGLSYIKKNSAFILRTRETSFSFRTSFRSNIRKRTPISEKYEKQNYNIAFESAV